MTLAQHLSRHVRHILAKHIEQSPADRFHRRTRHIIGAVLQIDDSNAGLSLHGIADHRSEFRIAAHSQVRGITGFDNLESAFRFGREYDMSVSVYHELKSPVCVGCLDRLLHRCQKEI